MQWIWFNDSLVEEENCGLSPFSRIRYGDGFFETIRVYDGNMPLLPFHKERILETARLLKLDISNSFIESLDLNLIASLSQKNKLADPNSLKMQLVFFRDGDSNGYTSPSKTPVIAIRLSQYYPKKNQFNPATWGVFKTVKKSLNALSAFKHNSALLYVLAEQWKLQQSLDIVLIQNEDGRIAESSNSNIIISYKDQFITPALSEACVNGCARRYILKKSVEQKIPIKEGKITLRMLKESDGIYLSNAINGLVQIKGGNAISKRLNTLNPFTD